MRGLTVAAGVILNIDVFEVACLARGWTTDAEVARQLSVAKTTVGRIRNRDQRPGGEFIAAVLRAFPHLGFEKLFTVLDDGETDEEPAA
jgi:transcriptional regulator with XRE-family HTH domain